MNEIAVSVIMPLYNVERYIRQSLNTIIEQTLKNIEIICVNDGSTDHTLKILEEYAEKDTRITIVTRKNGGCGVARNTGLKVAKGEYVIFLDGDDFFELNMLEEMYNCAKTDNSEIVRCGYYLYDDLKQDPVTHTLLVNTEEPMIYILSLQNEPDKLFDIGAPVACNKLIKRELLLKNNILFDSCKYRTDFSGFHTAMAMANQISIINKAFMYYRSTRFNNLTYNRHKESDSFLFDFYVLENLRKNLIRLNVFNKYERAYKYKCERLLKRNNTDRKKALIRLVVSDYTYNILYGENNEEYES